MIRSYIVVAIRNLLRQKTYTFINSFGLAITLTVCIFIFLFIHSETSYDSFYKESNQIYRVIGEGDDEYWGRVNLPMSELSKNYPGIESYTRIWTGDGILEVNKNKIKEEFTFVDPGFFDVFSLPFLYGNKYSAFQNEYSVVLSESLSKKYFGDENPVGKEISLQEARDLKQFVVTGVTAKISGNSSVKYSLLLPFKNVKHSLYGSSTDRNWGVSNLNSSLFIKLDKKNNRKAIETGISHSMVDYLNPVLAGKLKFLLQPVKNIHLSDNVIFSIQKSNNPLYSYILAGIGILILLLASINFINLTIMRSSHRFKEIGIRKVIGATRRKIFIQFITEAVILTFFSLVIALMLTEILLPAFNQFTGKHLLFDYFNSPVIAAGLILLMLALAFITGYYPALFMSKFKSVNILKGNQKLSGSKSTTRVMIAFQFFVSVALLISAVIMSEQFEFIQNKDLGFDKENVVLLNNDIINKNDFYPTLKKELLKYTGIKDISCSNEMPGDNPSFLWNFGAVGTNSTAKIMANLFFVDKHYLSTMGIKIKEGRNFSDAISSDTITSVIVNESFVRELDVKNPLGKLCSTSMFKGKIFKIIGVTGDYNFASLKDKIKPAVLSAQNIPFKKYIIVRLSKGNMIENMSTIKDKWESLSSVAPFTYTFLDDYLNKIYDSEKHWKDIVSYAGIFAIIIALLGLFGLTSYSVEKRIKEIGIRKILGADSLSIIKLFTTEFLILVLLANILAWPVVWYYANYWLQGFAYRINLEFSTFTLISLIVLFFALSITIVRVLIAANANPVKTLRYE